MDKVAFRLASPADAALIAAMIAEHARTKAPTRPACRGLRSGVWCSRPLRA